MAKPAHSYDGFDADAAVTRSLLGWGVVAGIFYLILGLAQAFTRDGFDLGRHPLSLLMLGDLGWVQRTNLVLSGSMVTAAGAGFVRAMRPPRSGNLAGILVGIFGIALILSGIFPPDPMAGFPPGAAAAEGTLTGVLHLGFGAIGFLALAISAFHLAAWLQRRRGRGLAMYSRASGAVILLGFVGGAALSSSSSGVLLLWVAVVTGWAWLAVASVQLYRNVPHPDAHHREESRVAPVDGSPT